MIRSVEKITVPVSDQAEALRWFTEVLGFEVRMDQSMGPARWLTVAPAGAQGGPELILHDPRGWMSPEAAAKQLEQVGRQPGLVLGTDDCRKTCADLEAKGVKIVQPPVQRPYGVEAVIEGIYGLRLVLVEAAR